MIKLSSKLVLNAAIALLVSLAPAEAATRLNASVLISTASDRQVHPVADKVRRKLIYVSAETKPCVGIALMTCLQVREKPSEPWSLHYTGIEGFEPKPGIEYRLRIIERQVENPPADGSSIRWSLDKIVKQRPARR